MRLKKQYLAAAVTLGIMNWTTYSEAAFDENLNEYTLDAVVVEADATKDQFGNTITEQSYYRTGGDVKVITREEIEKRHLFFWTQSRILNLMLLGDEVAITLGRDLHIYRQVYLLVSSLIVGFVVYAAGMIGFVGLIIPHIIRMLVGTDHKKLVPISALAGAIFLVLADGLCRIIIPKTELPIGILISLIGAPCFVYLMIKKTYGFGGN